MKRLKPTACRRGYLDLHFVYRDMTERSTLLHYQLRCAITPQTTHPWLSVEC